MYRTLVEISDWVGAERLTKRRRSCLVYLKFDDTIKIVLRLNEKLDNEISRFGVRADLFLR